jgi:4-amino-4-deoxy-L-arabinose transferase-like glycosyltransferase
MQQPIMADQLETSPPSEREATVPASAVDHSSPLSWLTVERAAYLGLALLALALRLTNLGVVPLSDAEATQALVAWRIYHDQPLDQVGYSPLIATLNFVGFVLLGGSEVAARLGPALLSVALVLLPYGLRRYLGRAGALAAAALFAISPTVVFLSRSVNGDIAAAVGGLTLTVGLFGWLDWEPNWRSSRLSWLTVAAAGLVLLLTASPSAYSTLALLLGFVVLAAVVGDKGHTASAREGVAALRTQLVSWGSLVLVLVVGLLAVATALLFNLDGLGATADLLTMWLRGFASTMAGSGVYPAIFLLTLYEALILLAGLFGLSISLMRRRLFGLYLAWWFLGGIVLNLLRSGRTQGEVLVPLVPLTLLAGLALGMLWDSLREEGSWQKEGILFITGLIIGGYAYVSLMMYTRSGGLTFWLPVAGLGLFVGLAVLFGLWYDGVSALRGAALVAVVLLLIATIATGARLNNQRLADPRQPLAGVPAAGGLPDMVATLEQLSSWQAGDRYLLDIIADRRLGPAVEWGVRRFQNVTWVDKLDSWPPTGPSDAFQSETYELGDSTVLLTPADDSLSLDEGYVGQDFAVRAFWSPVGLGGQSLIRWIMLRTASTPVNYEHAVLWVQSPPPAEDLEQEGKARGESIR